MGATRRLPIPCTACRPPSPSSTRHHLPRWGACSILLSASRIDPPGRRHGPCTWSPTHYRVCKFPIRLVSCTPTMMFRRGLRHRRPRTAPPTRRHRIFPGSTTGCGWAPATTGHPRAIGRASCRHTPTQPRAISAVPVVEALTGSKHRRRPCFIRRSRIRIRTILRVRRHTRIAQACSMSPWQALARATEVSAPP